MMNEERKTYSKSKQIPPGLTVDELTFWCRDEELDPTTTVVTGGHIKWQHVETDEEYEKRIEWQAAQDERHRNWVRERYEKLFGKQN